MSKKIQNKSIEINEELMNNILTFPLIPLEVYQEVKNKLKHKVRNTADLINVFNLLEKCLKSKVKYEQNIAKLIFFDFKYYINHPLVSKRKSTATTIEDRIAFLTNGKMTDVNKRVNPQINSLLSKEDIQQIPEMVQTTICSNYREKGDVLFEDDYKISVKSLMVDNSEINFGAFQFNTLFTGILEEDVLRIGERKNQIKKEKDQESIVIGRGSTAQLRNLFKYIKSIGRWEDFIKRWEICFKGVFQEDTIIYIKDPNFFEIYILDIAKFNHAILDSIKKNHDSNDLILNRWEGNSIRMDRKKLMGLANYTLKLEYSKLFNDMEIIEIIKSNHMQKINSLLKK